MDKNTKRFVCTLIAAAVMCSAVPVGVYGEAEGAFIYAGAEDIAVSGQGMSDRPEPPGPPPDMMEQTDEYAPVVVMQPKAMHYVIERSGYSAPEFSISAKLPDTVVSGSAFFEWFINDESVGDAEEYKLSAGSIQTSTFTAKQLLNRHRGVYRVYCEVSVFANGEKHSTKSYETAFIVCNGVKDNCFITFSDVHQTFSNISAAINNSIIKNNGYIPALVICSGDWVNRVHYMGENTEFYRKTADELIYRMSLQLGGIDAVYVSGNHDNGRAAAEATVSADLGAQNGYKGVGVIYNGKYVSASHNKDLVVIGLNYENAASVDEKSNVLSADNAAVIPELREAFERISGSFDAPVVVISAHSGLHVLGIQPESGAKEWSGSFEYNIDNSDKMVELINEYAEDMNIIYFFGHDHSKNEKEFLLLPGDKIISTSSYAERTYSENILKFAYTHAGYLTDSIGGREYFSYVSWDRGSITRKMYTAAKNKAVPSGLDFSLERKIKGKNSKDTAKTAGRNPIGGSSSKKAAAKTAVGDTGNDKTKRNGWVEYVLKTVTAFPDVIEQFDIK